MLNLKVELLNVTNGSAQVAKSATITQANEYNVCVKFYGTLYDIIVNGTTVIKKISSTGLNQKESNGYIGVGVYASSSSAIAEVQDIEISDVTVTEYLYNEIPKTFDKTLFSGDSNMMGQGVTEDERWADLTDNYLKTISPLEQYTNTGVGGNVIAQVLAQIKSNLTNKHDMCFILGGTNNSRVDEVGTTVEVAINHMTECIRYVKAFGCVPVVICPPIIGDVSTSTYNSSSVAWLETFRNKLKTLCIREKAKYIDIYSPLKGYEVSYLQSDKIHLNSAGHERVSNIVIEELQNKLPTF